MNNYQQNFNATTTDGIKGIFKQIGVMAYVVMIAFINFVKSMFKMYWGK